MIALTAIAEEEYHPGGTVKNTHVMHNDWTKRERDILVKVAGAVGSELENEARLLFTTLFSISRGRQRAELAKTSDFTLSLERALAESPVSFPSSASVACPGVEGSYSQQAVSAIVKFPTIFYFKSFEDVFNAVEKGMCDYGVLPIENSAVGSVAAVYDLMDRHRFKIVRAHRHRINHVLLAKSGVKLSDVREIHSHPHALSQCSAFLREHPEIRAVPSTNTAAAAAALAASQRGDVAVIASRECAELYGLEVIREKIADVESNFTRFICITKDLEIYPGADRTSLMMVLPHRPGSLYKVLSRFYALGINLNKLESRPMPERNFEFMFYFDLETSVYSPQFIQLMGELQDICEEFSYLGSYSEVI